MRVSNKRKKCNKKNKKTKTYNKKMKGGSIIDIENLNKFNNIKKSNIVFKQIYDFIRSIDMKITDIKLVNDKLNSFAIILYNNIMNNTFLFDKNYLSKIIITILRKYMRIYISEKTYEEQSNFSKKLEAINTEIEFNPEQGKILKQYSLTNLTRFPEKSEELLQTCADDEYYCPMNSAYYFLDYGINDIIGVEYLCNINDNTKINRISNISELNTLDDVFYTYCMLPNYILCLYKGNHSGGACGQPVICAGFIEIKNKKIFSINNSSGHYSPPSDMLIKAIDILISKKIVSNNYEKIENPPFLEVIFNTIPIKNF